MASPLSPPLSILPPPPPLLLSSSSSSSHPRLAKMMPESLMESIKSRQLLIFLDGVDNEVKNSAGLQRGGGRGRIGSGGDRGGGVAASASRTVGGILDALSPMLSRLRGEEYVPPPSWDDALKDFVSDLLNACGRVKMLVTGRKALRDIECAVEQPGVHAAFAVVVAGAEQRDRVLQHEPDLDTAAKRIQERFRRGGGAYGPAPLANKRYIPVDMDHLSSSSFSHHSEPAAADADAAADGGSSATTPTANATTPSSAYGDSDEDEEEEGEDEVGEVGGGQAAAATLVSPTPGGNTSAGGGGCYTTTAPGRGGAATFQAQGPRRGQLPRKRLAQRRNNPVVSSHRLIVSGFVGTNARLNGDYECVGLAPDASFSYSHGGGARGSDGGAIIDGAMASCTGGQADPHSSSSHAQAQGGQGGGRQGTTQPQPEALRQMLPVERSGRENHSDEVTVRMTAVYRQISSSFSARGRGSTFSSSSVSSAGSGGRASSSSSTSRQQPQQPQQSFKGGGGGGGGGAMLWQHGDGWCIGPAPACGTNMCVAVLPAHAAAPWLSGEAGGRGRPWFVSTQGGRHLEDGRVLITPDIDVIVTGCSGTNACLNGTYRVSREHLRKPFSHRIRVGYNRPVYYQVEGGAMEMRRKAYPRAYSTDVTSKSPPESHRFKQVAGRRTEASAGDVNTPLPYGFDDDDKRTAFSPITSSAKYALWCCEDGWCIGRRRDIGKKTCYVSGSSPTLLPYMDEGNSKPPRI
eukprot:jgi/Bigna1/81224/fgenesh1_pg.78_\